MTEKNQDNKYTTHWHSFWFGFISASSIMLFILLIGTFTDLFSFKTFNPKKVSVKKTEATTDNPISNLSFDDVLTEMAINKADFDTCMSEDRFVETVQANYESGSKAGVEGTPHSFVLIDDAIYEIPGAYEEAGMREFFDDLLAGNDPRAIDISAERDLAPVDEDDWIRGEEDARITVIEYSDVDCPFCKDFHVSTTNIMADYATDVRWVFRHMPIDNLHPDARRKAEASECIGELGGAAAFWDYIDALFKQ